MQSSRSLLRIAPRCARPTVRLQARSVLRKPITRSESSSTTSPKSPPSNTGAVVGGVAGGALVFLGGYAWYHFSGAKTFVNSAHKTKAYFDQAFKKTQEAAPEPSQALQWLRETATSYAAFIPGAKGYVDSAFNDLDKVHAKHGKEVDSIVKDAYTELKDVSKEGASIETVAKAWDVLQKHMKKIGDLASDAAGDLLDNHPELKDKVGGGLDQLKSMGNQYGPEAKKQVDETWQQVQDIIKGGVGVGSITKIQQLVQEKSEQLKKYGDQAWQKGMEQAQPILDKQPQLKDLVDKNKEKLLQGDLGQLWEKLKAAGKSGDTEDIKKFIEEQVNNTKSKAGGSGGGMDQLFKMIPGGDDIMPKLQKLQELSQKHGKEAENLIKEALNDIKGVLEKKVDEGQKLADKAKEDAKK